MNIYAGIYALNLVSELKKLINIYNNTKNLKSNFVFYLSGLFGKIQVSVEMIFKIMLQSENLSTKEFRKQLVERKINPLLFIEILRTFMKLYEFKQLRECGIHYYINQNLFYSDLMCVDKSTFEKQILNMDKNSGKEMIETDISKNDANNSINLNSTSNNSRSDSQIQEHLPSDSNSMELIIGNVKSSKTYINSIMGRNSKKIKLHPKILSELEKIKTSNRVSLDKNGKKNDENLEDNDHNLKRKHSKISFVAFMINLLNNNSHIQELVYLLKPLLHLLFIKLFGKNSMITFLLSLVLDYLSLRKKSSLYIDRNNEEKVETFSQKYLFNKEYQSRLSTITLSYLIRYPVIDYFTKPILSKVLFFLPESLRNFLLNDVLENMNLHYIISN